MNANSATPHGPFTLEATFVLITPNGDYVEVSFDCPPGSLPTEADMATLAGEAYRTVQETLPDGARWPSRREFVEKVFSERFGIDASASFASEPFEHAWAATEGTVQ